MTSKTTQKGNIGQAAVMLEALKKGYFVSVPSEGSPYDLVIDRLQKLERVQVKYAALYKGAIVVQFDNSTHKTRTQCHTPENCDAVAVYVPDTGNIYWIPSEKFPTHKNASMRLRIEPSANNQTKGINWASDYVAW